MSDFKKTIKYADKEIGFTSFFAILTVLILFFTRETSFLKKTSLVIATITFVITIYSLVSVNKKRKIIKNMKIIEDREKYKTYSKLYFVLNGIVFHEIISKIDGEDVLLGIDEVGIFCYLEDKKKDRQGKIPATKIGFNEEKLNITFKTLKFNRYLEGENIELEFTFRDKETRYELSFDRTDNVFTFKTYKSK